MNECIVCKKPLHESEILLNMNFHRHCSKDVIKEAWRLLDKNNE